MTTARTVALLAAGWVALGVLLAAMALAPVAALTYPWGWPW